MNRNHTPTSLAEDLNLPVSGIINFLNKTGRNITRETILTKKLVGRVKTNAFKIRNSILHEPMLTVLQTEKKTAKVNTSPDEINETEFETKTQHSKALDTLNDSVKLPRLLAAAKEFNIGQETLIRFLVRHDFDPNDLKPTSKLSEEMYSLLTRHFQADKAAKSKADRINLLLESFDKNNIEFLLGSQLSSARGIDHIIRKINKCIKRREPYLDLGNSALTDDSFAESSILFGVLIECYHLETLVLSSEWFEQQGKISILRRSSNTEKRNKLHKIPKFIEKLINLKTLILAGNSNQNGIKIEKIEHLTSLINLRHLDLSNNQITDIQIPETLKNLAYLDLSKNSISQLASFKGLLSLKYLNLSRNLLTDLISLVGLQNLNTLDLSFNSIQSVFENRLPTSLEYLDISANELIMVSGLQRLEKLTNLYINNNKLKDIHGLEFLIDKDSDLELGIAENPLLHKYQLKVQKDENHFQFIKELLVRQSDSSQKNIFVYPLKILILGNHGTGKSSLVNYLTGTGSSGSTHILRIENYYSSKKSSKSAIPDAIFYDFGGQDFYHGLYQAFISKGSLQIILYEQNTDKNELASDISGIPIINFDRRYWLGQKIYLENGSEESDPYIIIQTFIDKIKSINDSFNYSKYFGFNNSFNLSFCEDITSKLEKTYHEKAKDYFKAYFELILATNRITTREPRWYIEFLKFILNKQNRSAAPVEISTILPQYKAADLSEVERLESLKTNLVTLHRHGLVLYYPKIRELENYVWLNPQYFVEHIQEDILNIASADRNKTAKPGIIPKKQFESWIKDDRVILLLKEQKVIFLHRPTTNVEEEEYIIPNYLPITNKTDPEFQLFTFGLTQPGLYIKFNDFIPFGFINQMICFFGKEPDIKKFWRTQLLFTLDKSIRVHVEIDFEGLTVNIHYQSTTKYVDHTILREYIFYSIIALYWDVPEDSIPNFSEFLEIKQKDRINIPHLIEKINYWDRLQADPLFIPRDLFISIDGVKYVSYIELFQLEEDCFKINSYYIVENRVNRSEAKQISTADFAPFTQKKLFKMKKIFVSYSKFDDDYLEDFEDHLVTLKQEGIATFNCKKIEFGKEWDDEIKRQVDECDIMVCLISVKFLNTDYITKIEIPKAIEQNKIIVPIIIKACDWENSVLGKYQAAQRGKVVSLDNFRRLAGEIKAHSPEERAAFWTDIIKEFRQKLLVP